MSIILRSISDNWPLRTTSVGPASILENEAERDALSRSNPTAALNADIQRAIVLLETLYTRMIPYRVAAAEGERISKGGRSNKRVEAAMSRMSRAVILTAADVEPAYRMLVGEQIAETDKSVRLLTQAADALYEALVAYNETDEPDLFATDKGLRRFADYSGQIIAMSGNDPSSLARLRDKARYMASPTFLAQQRAAEESLVLLALCAAIGVSVNLTGTGHTASQERMRLAMLENWLTNKAAFVARRLIRRSGPLTKEVTPAVLADWAVALGADIKRRSGADTLLMPPVARFFVSLSEAIETVGRSMEMIDTKANALCSSLMLLLACADDCGIAEATLLEEATDLLADMMVAQ